MIRTRTRPPLRRPGAVATRWRDDRLGVLSAVLAVLVATVVGAALLLGRDDSDADPSSARGGFTGSDFHSLVADPAMPGRLYVGGHQAVSVSDDGGVSWRRLDALADVDAMGWGFDASGLWISGHPGILMSPDGGETVRRRSDALPDTDIHALGVGPDTVYAAGPGVGVLTSGDDGATWQSIATDDGPSFVGRMLVDGDDLQLLLAADAARGPVASSDGGATWEVLATLPVSWISVAQDSRSMYASGPEGAFVSDGVGGSWEPLNLPAGASLVEADPLVSGRLYAGVHDGASVTVFVSDDQGRNWRAASRDEDR